MEEGRPHLVHSSGQQDQDFTRSHPVIFHADLNHNLGNLKGHGLHTWKMYSLFKYLNLLLGIITMSILRNIKSPWKCRMSVFKEWSPPSSGTVSPLSIGFLSPAPILGVSFFRLKQSGHSKLHLTKT